MRTFYRSAVCLFLLPFCIGVTGCANNVESAKVVILYQSIDPWWGNDGSARVPIGVYNDEVSCHTTVQKLKEKLIKKSKNIDIYLCQIARSDDEAYSALQRIAERNLL